MVVVGGRAPANRWGSGSLQELDQPPILASVSKLARTLHTAADVLARPGRGVHRRRAPRTAARSSSTCRWTSSSTPRPARRRPPAPPAARTRTRTRSAGSPGCWPARPGPVLILGTDVWADRAEEAALRFVEDDRASPRSPTAWAAASSPAATRCWSPRPAGRRSAAATWSSWSAPRWTSGSATASSAARTAPRRPRSCTSPTPPARSRGTPTSPRRSSGDLTAVFDGLQAALERAPRRPDWSAWVADLQDTVAAATERDAALLGAEADPIHPARIYGELVPRLADDAVVIGDGGDFVSFAGKFVEPKRPGGWLDPGPYGCLGAGLGSAIAARLARPSAQVVLLLGDGAAGFSLMDVDTLVRHNLPVVMVMGNNSAWGLEKGPMQMLYGYDVIADLAPRTAYDEVVRALGGAGETVTDPRQIGAGARPRVRVGRALPGQRDHRRGGGLPARHVRDLSRADPASPARGPRGGRRGDGGGVRGLHRSARTTPTSSTCATPRPATCEAELWVATPDDSDEILGTVTICPRGVALAGARRARRGRVPDAGGRPRGAQRTGVGEALVRLVLDRFREQGATAIVLSSLPQMTDGAPPLRAARLRPDAGTGLAARPARPADRLPPGPPGVLAMTHRRHRRKPGSRSP